MQRLVMGRDEWSAVREAHAGVVVEIVDDDRGRRRRSGVDLVLPTTTPRRLHERLRDLGTVDLVVDLRETSSARRDATWRVVALHLRRGGTYAARRQAGDTDAAAVRRSLGRRHAQGDVRVGREVVEVVKAVDHLLKVRDADVVDLLDTRRGDVVATRMAILPAGAIEGVRAESHGTGPAYPSRLGYPAAEVRRYLGPVDLRPGAVAVADHLVLPDSYRWHLAANPVNRALRRGSPRATRLAGSRRDPRMLDGPYYFLDHENAGHYGHLMSEAVAKLWGWDHAVDAEPGVRLVLRDRGRTGAHDRQAEIARAYGIGPDRIAWVRGPVRVRDLTAATPLWHNAEPAYVHPAIREVWARLAHGLSGGDRSGPERVFVTRGPSDGNRVCRNRLQVEALAERCGYTVLNPGAMTMREQATAFARARVVAGFAGTGLFNLAFAEDVRAVVVLAHTAYDSHNERLYAAARGADVHVLRSRPEIEQPSRGWSYEAFQSAWTFDTARLGATLERLLTALG